MKDGTKPEYNWPAVIFAQAAEKILDSAEAKKLFEHCKLQVSNM